MYRPTVFYLDNVVTHPLRIPFDVFWSFYFLHSTPLSSTQSPSSPKLMFSLWETSLFVSLSVFLYLFLSFFCVSSLISVSLSLYLCLSFILCDSPYLSHLSLCLCFSLIHLVQFFLVKSCEWILLGTTVDKPEITPLKKSPSPSLSPSPSNC